MLAVHPAQLCLVKHGTALRDPIERKLVAELLHREDLLLRAIVPSQETQKVDHRLAEIPFLLKVANRGRTVAFGKLGLVRGQDQAHVPEGGDREPERLVDEDLTKRVRQVLLSTEDMCDLHGSVVDGHAEVVHWEAVGPQQDEIPKRVGVPFDLPPDNILDLDHLVLRHAEPIAVRGTLGHLCLDLLLGSGGPFAPVDGRQLLLLRLGLHLLQLLVGAEARVRDAGLDQLVHVLLIQLFPLALPVRTVLAADVRALVPLDAQPGEVPEHGLLGFESRPGFIRVFDPQNHLSSHVFRKEPVEERRPGPSDVQRTRGRRGKTHTHTAVARRGRGRIRGDLRRGTDMDTRRRTGKWNRLANRGATDRGPPAGATRALGKERERDTAGGTRGGQCARRQGS
mmetsp:Transcript_15232/g.43318  ORF Transcript_15232/g.43318 Transcript_15232/m.43318 type:complete len:397 (+) Transcript_15232:584-1774(+)